MILSYLRVFAPRRGDGVFPNCDDLARGLIDRELSARNRTAGSGFGPSRRPRSRARSLFFSLYFRASLCNSCNGRCCRSCCCCCCNTRCVKRSCITRVTSRQTRSRARDSRSFPSSPLLLGGPLSFTSPRFISPCLSLLPSLFVSARFFFPPDTLFRRPSLYFATMRHR